MRAEEGKWKTLQSSVEQYMEKWSMAEEGCHIVAGISGGADSVCLLFVLLTLKKKKNMHITAVHVNHMLRGRDAEHDEAFVKRLCERNGVLCRVFRIDAAGEARRRKCTVEEAGREIRRECMEQVLKEEHADRIALAHHRDDNAETIIMNLCRGTGIKGMRGILPCAGRYIRPLLCVRKAEIEEALKEKGVGWRTDATNQENIYTRNRIRNRIMGELEEINPKAAEHISQTAEKISAVWEYMEEETGRFKKRCIKKTEEGLLIFESAFSEVPEKLKSEVARGILITACGREKDLSGTHVENLLALFGKQTGREMDFPYGIHARRTYDGILLAGKDTPVKKEDTPKMEIRIFGYEKGQEKCWENWRENPYTKWFDYDIIKNSPILRHRRPGDYITVDGQGSRQKLKKFFINEKIPKEKRDSVWLIADGEEIMWIVGYRQNKAYQITDKTRNIMEIEIYGGK